MTTIPGVMGARACRPCALGHAWFPAVNHGPRIPVLTLYLASRQERPSPWIEPSELGTAGPHRGHIRATNDRIAADNSGHKRSRFFAAHRPHSARRRRSRKRPAVPDTEEVVA